MLKTVLCSGADSENSPFTKPIKGTGPGTKGGLQGRSLRKPGSGAFTGYRMGII